MSTLKEVSTGFIPRRLQLELRQNLRRFNVIVCHRRFGKTVFAINHQIDKMIRNQLPAPRAAYLAPTYGQAKRIVWDYLKKYTEPVPGTTPNEADLRVDYKHNDARQVLLSAENPASLRGIYLDDVLLDEYAEMDPSVWSEVIRPTLNDRKGSAIFIGTPKGQNNFYKLYEYAKNSGDPEWFAAMYKASETGIIDADELASAKRSMTEEEYEQEYECSFNAGLVGAYFAKELSRAEKEGRIGSFYHDPSLPVDTYWDLGIDDMASVWFVQSLRGRHRFIDYYEVCGASIPDVVREIKKKPYTLGEWVFPHDAQARDFSTGKAQIQIFHSLGCRPSRIIPRVGTKRESINAARMILSSCEFDAKNCKRGLECLSNYQRKWNAKNNVFEESPLHNWACFTPETEVLTPYGKRRMDMLEPTGEVLTPCGWKPYQNPRITKKNAPLVQVTFADGHTVRCTPEHLFLTENGWRSAEDLLPGSLIRSSLTRSRKFSMAASIALVPLLAAISQIKDYFTDTFGMTHLGQFPKAVISTTEITIRRIIGSITWSASPLLSTCPKPGREQSQDLKTILQNWLEKRLPIGTLLKRGGFGISGTLSGQNRGSSGSEFQSHANTAEPSLCVLCEKDINKNGARIHAESLLISSVQRLDETADVWDITVPSLHLFSLANGAVAHNSNGADAFQQFAMGARDYDRQTLNERRFGSTNLQADTTYNPFTRGA